MEIYCGTRRMSTPPDTKAAPIKIWFDVQERDWSAQSSDPIPSHTFEMNCNGGWKSDSARAIYKHSWHTALKLLMEFGYIKGSYVLHTRARDMELVLTGHTLIWCCKWQIARYKWCGKRPSASGTSAPPHCWSCGWTGRTIQSLNSIIWWKAFPEHWRPLQQHINIICYVTPEEVGGKVFSFWWTNFKF